MSEQKRKILVVEDDAGIRNSLIRLLSGAGLTVVGAKDGQDALDRLQQDPEFCVILLDLFMPRMDGWQFRESQLARPSLSKIPVVAMSASATALHARPLAVDSFLPKPFDLDRLIDLIERFCPN